MADFHGTSIANFLSLIYHLINLTTACTLWIHNEKRFSNIFNVNLLIVLFRFLNLWGSIHILVCPLISFFVLRMGPLYFFHFRYALTLETIALWFLSQLWNRIKNRNSRVFYFGKTFPTFFSHQHGCLCTKKEKLTWATSSWALKTLFSSCSNAASASSRAAWSSSFSTWAEKIILNHFNPPNSFFNLLATFFFAYLVHEWTFHLPQVDPIDP